MIIGIVNANEDPISRLIVYGQGAIMHEVEAVVDTGFNEYLSLPKDLIDALGLPYLEEEIIRLANGQEEVCRVFAAEVIWDGEAKAARVQANEGSPLIGMALMRGYEINIQARVGGDIRLTKMTDVDVEESE